jgi:hypothetical protein
MTRHSQCFRKRLQLMLSDVSTSILFMELHRRLASHSVGQSVDQFFTDVEQGNSQTFSQLDVALHDTFIAHAQVVLQRIADNEDS